MVSIIAGLQILDWLGLVYKGRNDESSPDSWARLDNILAFE